MPKVVVPITLDLSADQIELLDRHGDLVADLFGKIIQQAHTAKQSLDLEQLQADVEARRVSRQVEIANLERLAHRLRRIRMSDAPA